MQRAAAIIGSAIFLVIAPGTLAVYVPWYLTHWHFAPPVFPIARVLGAALIVAGLPILLDSFARFALQGLGTPAPVMPPKRLVVTGFYRYVRNPMYVAVTALIAGQGLLFGSVTVLVVQHRSRYHCAPALACIAQTGDHTFEFEGIHDRFCACVAAQLSLCSTMTRWRVPAATS